MSSREKSQVNLRSDSVLGGSSPSLKNRTTAATATAAERSLPCAQWISTVLPRATCDPTNAIATDIHR
eukprot:CAMPEP_0183312232 /NCGR_PEP_ID=MMETSP0160_2-20130417/40846_1 /TAXON_ID=2839 ORGANISM="Odontella Sinensis, Strain Grunow 1884" /NCGR_SAMPLE_ID=MMETSP0160_2 /ASSEMBLY_ACC=CAM_ASM_000250 /LENGTH=67 /DNA_ID=CAMNT_0025477047 /DNA_START=420 /DNA_END=619 /DNA_ORIENTATION=+